MQVRSIRQGGGGIISDGRSRGERARRAVKGRVKCLTRDTSISYSYADAPSYLTRVVQTDAELPRSSVITMSVWRSTNSDVPHKLPQFESTRLEGLPPMLAPTSLPTTVALRFAPLARFTPFFGNMHGPGGGEGGEGGDGAAAGGEGGEGGDGGGGDGDGGDGGGGGGDGGNEGTGGGAEGGEPGEGTVPGGDEGGAGGNGGGGSGGAEGGEGGHSDESNVPSAAISCHSAETTLPEPWPTPEPGSAPGTSSRN